MDERTLQDIIGGIEDKYINETASAIYENESRNVTNSDDLIIVENRIKKFPFALVTAAVVVIAIVSVIAGVVLFNSQSINTLDSGQKQEYPLFHEDMLAVEKDGKWGYINKSGEWVIEPQFDEACAFQKNGYAIVGIETKDDRGFATKIYGLIDKSGNYVIEPTFGLLYPFDDNGLALVKGNDDAGYIDISGKDLTKPGFTSSKTTRFWSNDYAVVGDRTAGGIKVGVIDSKGKYIIGPQYNNVFILENDLFMVENKNVTEGSDTVATERCYGIIDKNYNIILPVEYYSIIRGDDGIYAVERYGDAYHIDKNGNPLYEQRFDFVSVFDENGVAVACTKDNMYGLIDKSGNYITEPVYDYILNWGSFGTYLVKKDSKYGFINYKNEKITDIIFEDAEIFQKNGLAIVVKDGKYGCINKDGEFAVQPVYLSISSFTDGVAVAETKDGFILINEKGEQITNKTYSYLGNIRNERVAFYDGKVTFGYLDYNGNVIFSQTFGEDVRLWVNSYSDDGYTVVYNLDDEGKIKGFGVIDHEGNFISDLCFGNYYAYEYVEEIIGDREPDIIINVTDEEEKPTIPETTLPDSEDKPISAITFPDFGHINDITAYQAITDNMKLNVDNINVWLPYASKLNIEAEWYIEENEKGKRILKSSKAPDIFAPTGGNICPDVYIGDYSLRNYSMLVKFRFGNSETIRLGLYYDTFVTESDFTVDMPSLGWFELDSNGKLYRTGVFSTPELVMDVGEIDKDSYHTIQIENNDGSLQLIFDGKNYGEIAKVDNNQYGAFGIGGFEIEIEEMSIYDTEKYDAPIFNFAHLPGKLRNEFWKAEIGTDIEDREKIGLISAFVTGDTSLLPEDTDEDVRTVFEEIYSTIVIKDYFIDEDKHLHFVASYPGKSTINAYEEYEIYNFDQPINNLHNESSDYTAPTYDYTPLQLDDNYCILHHLDISILNTELRYNHILTDLIVRDIHHFSNSEQNIENFRTTKEEITAYAKNYLCIDFIPLKNLTIIDENGNYGVDPSGYLGKTASYEFLRSNYNPDGTTEDVFRFCRKGDHLKITEDHIRVYTLQKDDSGHYAVLSVNEYFQTANGTHLSLDYLGSTELQLTPEDVIYAYQKYLNEQNWELLNVLWYGNEMKWCGSKGDAESMLSDIKITACKNVTEEEYADRFDIGINELIYHITYESDSKGEGSMHIKLKKDGANYYIKETITG